MESIGLFQLENLMISRSPFIFLDVRIERVQELPAPIAKHLSAAKPLQPIEVLSHVQGLVTNRQQPILLICEDEKGSGQVARDLEAAGYSNVYIVAGGVSGLLSEL